MRSGVFLPLFDPLADPAAVARLASEAEEAGWDGFFVWDQIRWREPVAAVGDTQVTLAAIAAATERIRLGPLVTPLARRRPAKVARETAALDLLSGGRLTLGVGLGSDRFASVTRSRARSSTTAVAPGCSTRHSRFSSRPGPASPYATAASTTPSTRCAFCPGPSSARAFRFGWRAFPAIPGRCAAPPATTALPGQPRQPDQLVEIVARVDELRQHAGHGPPDTYDVVAELEPGIDPAPYGEAGATWWLVAPEWEGISVDQVRGLIRDGPVAPRHVKHDGAARPPTPPTTSS